MHDAFQAFRRILRLKARRLMNRYRRMVPFSGSRAGDQQRNRTARTSGGGRILSFLVLFLFLMPVFFLVYVLLVRLQVGVTPDVTRTPSPAGSAVGEHAPPDGWSGTESDWAQLDDSEKNWINTWARAVESAENQRSISTIISMIWPREELVQSRTYLYRAALLLLIAFFAKIGLDLGLRRNRTVTLDMDLEWMLTMPVSPALVYAAKVIERTLLDVTGWLIFTAFYGLLLWFWGYTWTLPALLVGAVLLTNFIAALVTFATDVFLHRLFSRYVIESISAGFHLVYIGLIVLIFPLMSLEGLSHATEDPYFLLRWADTLGVWLLYNPLGLGLYVVQNGFSLKTIGLTVGLGAEFAGLFAVWFLFVHVLSRHGLEVIQSGHTPGTAAETAALRSFNRCGRLGTILKKELLLLWRNKNLVIQMLVPLFFLAMYWIPVRYAETLFLDRTMAVGIAVSLGMYLLMTIAPMNVYYEQQGLWLNYTVPRSPANVLLSKTLVWSGVSLIYMFAFYGYTVVLRGTVSVVDLGYMGLFAPALVLYALCGAGFGVIGADPLASESRDRMRMDLVLIYIFIGVLFLTGLFTPGVWPRLVSLLIFGALTGAVVHKGRIRVPYLLDPTEEPPRTLDASDGLLYIALFFFVQNVAGLLLVLEGVVPPGPIIVLSYFYGGLVTVVVSAYLLWRTGTSLDENQPFFNLQAWTSIPLYAIPVGALMAGIGLSYQWMIEWLPFVQVPERTTLPMSANWLYLLALVGAPVFEEFLFRGLLFNGLKSSFTFWPAALLSAALFAVVHPPTSLVPVFLAGLATAWVFERTGNLLAPIGVHAIYNGVIVIVLM